MKEYILVTNIEGDTSTTASITVFGEFCARFFMVILYTIILARQRELCGAVSLIIWYTYIHTYIHTLFSDASPDNYKS